MADSRIYQRYHQYYRYIQPILADPVVRSYFGLIASAILITILIFSALSPTINVIIGLRKKIADQRVDLEALSTKIDNLIIAQQTLSEIENYLPLLEQIIPLSPRPEEVIERVKKSASDSGVVVSELQFQTIPLGDFPSGTQTVNFAFSVGGEERAVRQFLGKLENQRRYLQVKSLTLTDIKKGVKARVEAEAYYFSRR